MDNLKQGVTEVVTTIYQQHGQVSPTALVTAARPESSPAHNAFEWDDSKAGEEYRLMQARQWIRRVEILIEDQPTRMVHVPIIQREDSNEGYYKPITVISADEYQLALGELKTKVGSAVAALDDLKKAAVKTQRKQPPKRLERALRTSREVVAAM